MCSALGHSPAFITGRVPIYTLQFLQTLYPSGYWRLKQCEMKMVLELSYRHNPLLPLPPEVFKGKIYHSMHEAFSRGRIDSRESFSEELKNATALAEKEAERTGSRPLIPIQNSIRDFGVFVASLREQLLSRGIPAGNRYQSFSSKPETPLATKDRTIAGRPDLMRISGDESVIIELKSGSIYSDGLSGRVIREDYRIQLLLYAVIFNDLYGRYPDRLMLESLSDGVVTVPFTPEECDKLLQDVKDTISRVNYNIKAGTVKANPSAENCKFCSVRPACKEYREQIFAESSDSDLYGTVQKFQKGLIGILLITLQSPAGDVWSVRINRDILQADTTAEPGMKTGVFNIIKRRDNFTAQSTKTTAVYFYDN